MPSAEREVCNSLISRFLEQTKEPAKEEQFITIFILKKMTDVMFSRT